MHRPQLDKPVSIDIGKVPNLTVKGARTEPRRDLDSLTRFQIEKRKAKEKRKTDRLIDRQFRLKGKREMLNASLKYCRDYDVARMITDIRNATDQAIQDVRREIAQRLQDSD